MSSAKKDAEEDDDEVVIEEDNEVLIEEDNVLEQDTRTFAATNGEVVIEDDNDEVVVEEDNAEAVVEEANDEVVIEDYNDEVVVEEDNDDVVVEDDNDTVVIDEDNDENFDQAVHSTSTPKRKKGGSKKKQREEKENVPESPDEDLASTIKKRKRVSQAVGVGIYQNKLGNKKGKKKEVIIDQDASDDDGVASRNGMDINEGSKEQDVEVENITEDVEMTSLDSESECNKQNAAHDKMKGLNVYVRNCGKDENVVPLLKEFARGENDKQTELDQPTEVDIPIVDVDLNDSDVSNVNEDNMASSSREKDIEKPKSKKAESEKSDESVKIKKLVKDAVSVLIGTCKRILPREEACTVGRKLEKYMKNFSSAVLDSDKDDVYALIGNVKDLSPALLDSDPNNVYPLIKEVMNKLKKYKGSATVFSKLYDMSNMEKQMELDQA